MPEGRFLGIYRKYVYIRCLFGNITCHNTVCVMNCHLIALHEAVGRSTLGGGFHRGGCGGSDGWVIGALEPRRAGGYRSPITLHADTHGQAAAPAEMIIAPEVDPVPKTVKPDVA